MWGFTVRGSWRPNITEIFWPQSYGRQRCVFSFSRLLNRSPGVLSDGCWLSLLHHYQQLLWSPNSIGVPKGPFGRVWLSLPHLVSNCCNSTQLSSVKFVGLMLPSNSTRRYGHASTPPQFLPISGDRDVSLPLSLEMACVIVIERK